MRVIFMATRALNVEKCTQQEGNKMENEKTFTQAEMDSIIEGRLAREHEKYADYDSLKEKAGKYDEMQEQSKSELQKANEKANALQAKLDQLEKDGTVR